MFPKKICNYGQNIFRLFDIFTKFSSKSKSPHVQESVIISYKFGIHELPHESTKENRKYQESLKLSRNYSLLPSLPVPQYQ